MKRRRPRLGRRFVEAFRYAHHLHHHQPRKGSEIPYLAHLLGVAGAVLEHSGDEDVAIAALLHDAVEDQGGRKTLAQIRRRFGPRVASIVAECSDRLTTRKGPWRKRKLDYLARLRTAPRDARLVSLADKVNNAAAIVRDLETVGGKVWRRFGGGRAGTLWYYRELAKAFRRGSDPPTLVRELVRLVGRMRALSHWVAGRPAAPQPR